MREIEGILYCNDGDWVESLTALVEHRDGTLEIIGGDARIAPAAAGTRRRVVPPIFGQPGLVPCPLVVSRQAPDALREAAASSAVHPS
jgi:hypothetical protein